jgi:hypothetical protein
MGKIKWGFFGFFRTLGFCATAAAAAAGT